MDDNQAISQVQISFSQAKNILIFSGSLVALISTETQAPRLGLIVVKQIPRLFFHSESNPQSRYKIVCHFFATLVFKPMFTSI